MASLPGGAFGFNALSSRGCSPTDNVLVSSHSGDVCLWHEAGQAAALIRVAAEGQTDVDHSLFEVSLLPATDIVLTLNVQDLWPCRSIVGSRALLKYERVVVLFCQRLLIGCCEAWPRGLIM
jgi:hypothetical protein